jgi:hypothetical protein
LGQIIIGIYVLYFGYKYVMGGVKKESERARGIKRVCGIFIG